MSQILVRWRVTYGLFIHAGETVWINGRFEKIDLLGWARPTISWKLVLTGSLILIAGFSQICPLARHFHTDGRTSYNTLPKINQCMLRPIKTDCVFCINALIQFIRFEWKKKKTHTLFPSKYCDFIELSVFSKFLVGLKYQKLPILDPDTLNYIL